MRKYIHFIMIFVIILLIGYLFYIRSFQVKEYNRNLFYMDTYSYVRIFSNSEKKAVEALDYVETLYKEYHELSDRYQEYSDIVNLYTIYHNHSDQKEFILDTRLHKMLQYGYDWYSKSDGLFHIQMGSVIDIWKQVKENHLPLPTLEELQSVDISMDRISLTQNGIMNTHPNIDLGGLAKGYATNEAARYLKEQGLTQFIINAGGNVFVGDHYGNETYKIGIESPNPDESLVTVVHANNLAIVTSGSYERFYEYNGKQYSHILDPKTLYPSEYVKSVTVLASDSALADVLSTTLFLMPVSEGLEFIKQYDQVEAIWYTIDNQVIRSEGFSQYE